VKKFGSDAFLKSGRFFRLVEKFDWTEQGAGELGPLGSAGRTVGLPTGQTKLIERNGTLRAFPKLFSTRFQTGVVARVSLQL